MIEWARPLGSRPLPDFLGSMRILAQSRSSLEENLGS